MKRKTSAVTLIELLVVLAILAMLAFLVLGAAGGCNVSDGNRVGIITKFSHKGTINKSWEGELVMGGYRAKEGDGTVGIVANIWHFSVLDDSLVGKIERLQDNGHRAKLTYHQTMIHNPVRRDTAYIVTAVTDLETHNTPEK